MTDYLRLADSGQSLASLTVSLVLLFCLRPSRC